MTYFLIFGVLPLATAWLLTHLTRRWQFGGRR